MPRLASCKSLPANKLASSNIGQIFRLARINNLALLMGEFAASLARLSLRARGQNGKLVSGATLVKTIELGTKFGSNCRVARMCD